MKNIKTFLKKFPKKLIQTIKSIKKCYSYNILGYIKPLSTKDFSEDKLNYLNSFIPKTILVNHPDIYQYNNIDSYYIYSYWIY